MTFEANEGPGPVDLRMSRGNDKTVVETKLSSNADYIHGYEEQIEKYQKLRLLETIDIVDVVNTIKSDADITKDPFVVYISGIDTSGNVASKARSDVNILIGVNPETKNILMVNNY